MYQFFPDLAPKRAKARSEAERTNPQFKDNHGGRNARVRGAAKVICHLMFGVVVMTAEALFRFTWPAPRQLNASSREAPAFAWRRCANMVGQWNDVISNQTHCASPHHSPSQSSHRTCRLRANTIASGEVLQEAHWKD